MSKKTFNLISGIIGGVEAITVAIVTYCVADASTAAAVNACIVAVGTVAIECCSRFVKE